MSETGGMLESREPYYCSFCAKSQYDVRKLIAGPTAFICDECICVCAAICMSDEGRSGTGIWYVSRTKPVDTKSLIKTVIAELRAEQDSTSPPETP